MTKDFYDKDEATYDQGDPGVIKVPEFSFQGHTGKMITDKDYKDHVYVATFFFSTCTDICPMMSKSMTRVQETFKDNDEVMLLSYSLDPKNDSLPVLVEYAEAAEAVEGKWNFVRGEEKEIYKHAREGHKVVARKDSTYQGGIDHGNKLMLINKQGFIEGYYDGLSKPDVDRLIKDIRAVLNRN